MPANLASLVGLSMAPRRLPRYFDLAGHDLIDGRVFESAQADNSGHCADGRESIILRGDLRVRYP